MVVKFKEPKKFRIEIYGEAFTEEDIEFIVSGWLYGRRNFKVAAITKRRKEVD